MDDLQKHPIDTDFFYKFNDKKLSWSSPLPFALIHLINMHNCTYFIHDTKHQFSFLISPKTKTNADQVNA